MQVFVFVFFKFKNFKAQSLEIFKWVDLKSTAKTKRKSQTYALIEKSANTRSKSQIRVAFASGVKHLLALASAGIQARKP